MPDVETRDLRRLPVAAGTTFPKAARTPVEDAVTGRPGLTPRMRRATIALSEALFHTDAGPPPAERTAWLADELDDFLSRAGPRARLVYRLCLLAVSVLAPLRIGRLPPFRRLDAATRTRALARMERSAALGLAVLGAKTLLAILYYEHPDAAREIGFDGACMHENAP